MEEGNVASDEVGILILSDQSERIFALDVEVGFVKDLMRVSGVSDVVAEKRNDCPVESDDAPAICHDDVHDRGLHQVHKHRALGVVVEGISFF